MAEQRGTESPDAETGSQIKGFQESRLSQPSEAKDTRFDNVSPPQSGLKLDFDQSPRSQTKNQY